MRFEGKVVLVTGAASGIGAETAARFAAEGATVVAADLAGGDGIVACDVRDRGRVFEVVQQAVAAHGGVDVVANVAGVTKIDHFTDVTPETWALMYDVNVTGPFHVIQSALPSLLKRRGNVVNVGSVAGLRGMPYQAGYGSSKAALIHLTKSLAVEYATRGVRFNVVCPGTVHTPLVEGVAAAMPQDLEPALLGRMQGVTPGIIEPGEIAEAILYVAGADARSMTGHALTVDLGVVC